MASDDFEVVQYKILSYLYDCIKAGAIPNIDKMKELAKVNDIYFETVFDDLLEDGLVSATYVGAWGSKLYLDPRITAAGAAFLKENSRMAKVSRFLGSAFSSILAAAIEATKAL